MLLVNLVITGFCAWGIAKVFNIFIRRSRINSYRFRFFELRDRLTVLVLKGKVSSSDKEYLTLLKLLNSSICVFDDNYTFSGFFRYLSRLVSNAALARDIREMVKKLKAHNNIELAAIACEYFELNYAVFTKYTRLTPLSLFINLLSFSVTQLRDIAENKKQIDKILENNMHQLEFAKC
jgi:hypothetical protein